jgi:hypothetical protein
MGKFLETKLIAFYANRGFVLKRYAKPIVSFLFQCFAGCIYATLAIALLASVNNISLNSLQIQLVFILFYLLIVVLGYFLFLRRIKLLK